MAKARFYVKETVVTFEEDAQHEFKGHRNLAVEELPPWCFVPGTDRRSRRAVSRHPSILSIAIHHYLYQGRGGTVFLGIVDEGVVKGIRLSQYQKDHVCVSMNDLMSRYEPKVDSARYNVEFVPVVPRIHEKNPFEQEYSLKSEDHGRLKPHLLRTPEYCWCDREAIAQYALGSEQSHYVIEITIHPYEDRLTKIWDNKYRLNLHPVYQDEEGNCYFRRQASLVQYKHADIYEQTKEEVKQFYEVILNKLQEQIREAKGLHQKLPFTTKPSFKSFTLGCTYFILLCFYTELYLSLYIN